MASSLPRLRTHFCSPACTAVMYRDIGTRSGGFPLPSPQGCRWQRSISRRLCCRGKGSSFSWSRRTFTHRSVEYPNIRISCRTINPWLLHRQKELSNDRHDCGSQIQCDRLQHCRDRESKQSETVWLFWIPTYWDTKASGRYRPYFSGWSTPMVNQPSRELPETWQNEVK